MVMMVVVSRVMMMMVVVGYAVTSDEEALTPGADGRLISTDERMQQVRQAQTESPTPQPHSTDGLSVTLCVCLCVSVSVCTRVLVVAASSLHACVFNLLSLYSYSFVISLFLSDICCCMQLVLTVNHGAMCMLVVF